MTHEIYPPGFEEDDQLRSRFIRTLSLAQMTQSNRDTASTQSPTDRRIPHVLVQYWHDRYDVPADVRECMHSWDALRHEGFVIRIFDDLSASRYLVRRYGAREREAFARCHHPAMRSDYFRLCYIVAEGGLYVDADDVLAGDGWRGLFLDAFLKVHPLGFDVTSKCMLSDADLQRNDLPERDTIFYVNNNPIAAPPEHAVMRRALARATAKLLREHYATDIQSTTGPGNLTAALCAHARDRQLRSQGADYRLLFDWERTAMPRWDLSYRGDARNWRNLPSPGS